MTETTPIVTVLTTHEGKTRTMFRSNRWSMSASRQMIPLFDLRTGEREYLRDNTTEWTVEAKTCDLAVGPEALLKQFLYLLMRDHLTPGYVAGILKQIQADPTTFTNPHLAALAEDYTEALLSDGQIRYSQGRTE